MCGIAGVVALRRGAPVHEQVIASMCSSIEHRGPDATAVDVAGGVGLGIQRLSIIDVEGGNQPIFNEDRTVRTVFNGEIYNYRELRRDLSSRGHTFSTLTDTEVIVHGWEEYGVGIADRLNGMFAIALHDLRHERFVLIRDRMGVKPLYYASTGTYLVFGSEPKALLASRLVEARLNVDAVGQFLAWEYVPGRGTLFDGVLKLEPGALLEVDLNDSRPRVEPRSWWDLAAYSAPETERSEADWEAEVDSKVRDCVKRQLVADVPVGALLSGGVDSSLVVAGMGRTNTFSIGFDDPSYDELTWARRVAAHLGVDHRDEVIRPAVVDVFDRLMDFMDDPIGDVSIFPTYLVSKLAGRHVKVVLSGDGGDELFGGYDTYAAQAIARSWARVPAALRKRVLHPLVGALRPRPEKKGLINMARRFVEGFDHDRSLGHARWRLFASETALTQLLAEDVRSRRVTAVAEHIVRLAERAGARPELDVASYIDLRSYLSDNILVKLDRMSMAASIEARVPYLDHELVELAFRVPERLKLRGRETKVLLKRVAARYLPRDAIHRPKQGFSVPMKLWLGQEFRPLLEDLLAPARLSSDGLFAPEHVTRLKEDHLAGRENNSHVLWALLVFQAWRRRWCPSS